MGLPMTCIYRSAAHFLCNECLPKVDISVCCLLSAIGHSTLTSEADAEGGWEPGGEGKHLCLKSQGLPREKGVWLLGSQLLGSSRTVSFLVKGISHFQQHRKNGSPWCFSQLKFLALTQVVPGTPPCEKQSLLTALES